MSHESRLEHKVSIGSKELEEECVLSEGDQNLLHGEVPVPLSYSLELG